MPESLRSTAVSTRRGAAGGGGDGTPCCCRMAGPAGQGPECVGEGMRTPEAATTAAAWLRSASARRWQAASASSATCGVRTSLQGRETAQDRVRTGNRSLASPRAAARTVEQMAEAGGGKCTYGASRDAGLNRPFETSM